MPRRFSDWDVNLSPALFQDGNCTSEFQARALSQNRTVQNASLHRETSMRSFRTEKLARL